MNRSTSAIAVVIVTYNSAGQLGTVLDSLSAGCDGVDLVDVVVADNLSTDDTVDVAKQPRDIPVRVVQLGRNAGYAAGVNAAVASLTAHVDAYLLLNPDITMHPRSAVPLAHALGQGARAIVFPQLRNPDGTLQPSLRRKTTLPRTVAEALVGGGLASRLGGLGELIMESEHYHSAGPTVWATGAAMLVSMQATRDIGPWDESFLLYGEETEFALRAADRGWELWYEPESVMDHVGGEQTVTNPSLHALLTVNRVRLYRRRHNPVAGAVHYGAVTLGEALRAVGGRRTAQAALAALLCPSRRLRELPGDAVAPGHG
ncbi:glycosyltransferase family 2 protein [Pseudonocardia sp. 73-21]|uniref:glycosyltransferase family 2 protein n=1 Tax=Pseudonocardia sp. 73-21 TaxID=1895809 RepID=UPI000965953B|nr:glycosyltransferase family 2 protein [Pseudonocardia sp. 73-21]OJY39704.1 MAG: glycosyl transferase family 2 [Pseudonocardia sp. 73-21]